MNFLDFEKPIAALEGKIEELKHLSDTDGVNISDEVGRLQTKLEKLLQSTYSKLTAWQKVQVARHPDRPHCLDYVEGLFTDFQPLAGDRCFGEDAAIIGGLGRFRGQSVMVIGQEKGHDTETRIRHNFGMPNPEGYRKAKRLMEMADRFNIPVISFVDTTGANPGVEAEERGQAEAIARSTEACLNLRVPMICTVIGEGGSGGAIAIAAGNTVMMLEHAVYSVISPEGCASILWRSDQHAQQAADALRITAQDLRALKVIDRIIEEPMGGAHRNRPETIARVGDAIAAELDALMPLDPGVLREKRREKFLNIGRNLD
jgi:acetyl-CoA carboxylase carboxyl transferase subunit alpha